MNFNDIAAQAATQDVVPGKGNFERPLPREGVALLRLVSYLELGVHPAKNPTHKDARKVRLGFELLHPDHMITGTKQDGTDFRFPDTLNVYCNIGGPTSKFGKLFTKMNYDNDATFMYQLLGRPFFGTLTHNKVGDGADAKTYVNLDKDGEWKIGAPVHLDPVTNETKPIPVPEAHGEVQMFLYNKAGLDDAAVQFMWDSIYIDGENQEGKSKNWIQNTIKESVDFHGSITQRIADGLKLDVDTSVTEAPASADLSSDDMLALGIA